MKEIITEVQSNIGTSIDVTKENNDIFLHLNLERPMVRPQSAPPSDDPNQGVSLMKIQLNPSFCRKLKSILEVVGY